MCDPLRRQIQHSRAMRPKLRFLSEISARVANPSRGSDVARSPGVRRTAGSIARPSASVPCLSERQNDDADSLACDSVKSTAQSRAVALARTRDAACTYVHTCDEIATRPLRALGKTKVPRDITRSTAGHTPGPHVRLGNHGGRWR